MTPRCMLSAIIISLSSCLCHAQEAAVESGSNKNLPSEFARALMNAHDQLAAGQIAMKRRLPGLAAELAEQFLALDGELWKQSRNVQAAVAYTLSGGQPRVLRAIIQTGVIPMKSLALAQGALAYVEGREDKARELLGQIDADQISASTAGLVALAQAALAAKAHPDDAARLLDKARIYAPGGLVEEAALRRSVSLAYAASDFDRFVSASSQYFRRFGKSIYAEEFRRQFARSIVQFGLSVEPEQKKRLSEFLFEIEASYRADLYLSVAERALYIGKLATTLSAAEKASAADSSSTSTSRAALYAGAAKILSGDIEQGMKRVAQSADDSLSKRDKALKDVVVRLAQQLKSDPAIVDETTLSQPDSWASSSATMLIQRVDVTLSDVDELLQGNAR